MAQTPVFRLGLYEGTESDPTTVAWRKVFAEAFWRLGYQMTWGYYPPARISLLIERGEIDGEMARMRGDESLFPHLWRVDESMMSVHLVMVVKRADLTNLTLQSLRKQNLRVGYLRGITLAEERLTGRVRSNMLNDISSSVQGMGMLAAGRLDVFVDFDTRVDPLLASPENDAWGLRKDAILEDVPLYPYVNQKYAPLASDLAKTLRVLKNEGFIDKLLKEAATHPGSK